MKAIHHRTVGFVLAVVACLGVPAAAQDDVVPADTPGEPSAPEPRETNFFAEYEYAHARPAGSDLRIGTVYDSGTGAFQSLYLPDVSDTATAYRLGWSLPGNLGTLVGTYRTLSTSSSSVVSRPGQFVIGTTEALAYGAGLSDDGLADSVSGSSEIRTHEVQLDWRFRVAERPRVLLDVSFGIRSLNYRQGESITYAALDPGLPPLIEPGGDDLSYLFPFSDRVSAMSDYSGRGVQASLLTVVPIFGDRLQFEALGTFGVLRGTARADYSSSTATYVYDDGISQTPLTFEEFLDFARAGEFGNLNQVTSFVALNSPGRSVMNPMVELSLGLRSRVWAGLELSIGGRMSYVQDVVYELRPGSVAIGPAQQLFLGAPVETWRNAGFESVFGTVGYRF